jgi:hypothetical protein
MSRGHKEVPYFECHITVENKHGSIQDDEAKMREILETHEKGQWKFSKLEDDIILGPGSKMYATTHYPTDYGLRHVRSLMAITIKKLQESDLKVIRSKVETVVYDQLHT